MPIVSAYAASASDSAADAPLNIAPNRADVAIRDPVLSARTCR